MREWQRRGKSRFQPGCVLAANVGLNGFPAKPGDLETVTDLPESSRFSTISNT